MIGKIMSEAAYSIIGMLSAKPLVMENKASVSDFGSFLQAPEDQRHSNPKAMEADVLEEQNASVGETDPAPTNLTETDNIPPFINQSFGNRIFGQNRSLHKIEASPGMVDVDGSVDPDSKLSITFNRDILVGEAVQNDSVIAMSVADGEALQSAPVLASEIILPQANVTLGNETHVNSARASVALDGVDGRAVNQDVAPKQSADLEDGVSRLDPQAQKTGRSQFRSNVGEQSDLDEIFPSSEKGLLKLQGLQPSMRGEMADLAKPIANLTKLVEAQDPDTKFIDPSGKTEAIKPMPSVSPLVARAGEHTDARSAWGRFESRLTPGETSQKAPVNVQNPVMNTTEAAEAAKTDLRVVAKSPETLVEQPLVTNSIAQMAVRETIQKPTSFDMSSPQIAQRLAAEISDISVAGGPKTFELNPRNLGRMEITFTTRGSTEIIEIQTEHRATKDIIGQHSQLLQDILKGQGRDDLTLRVDVKEHMSASTRNDGTSLSQQENRDAREQPARPSQRRHNGSSLNGSTENDPAPDNSRYA